MLSFLLWLTQVFNFPTINVRANLCELICVLCVYACETTRSKHSLIKRTYSAEYMYAFVPPTYIYWWCTFPTNNTSQTATDGPSLCYHSMILCSSSLIDDDGDFGWCIVRRHHNNWPKCAVCLNGLFLLFIISYMRVCVCVCISCAWHMCVNAWSLVEHQQLPIKRNCLRSPNTIATNQPIWWWSLFPPCSLLLLLRPCVV